ncbi:pPIWI-associating nuclease domain-containing protein [Photobacterium damselae]|uniref:pPIWI-associating nuclease domain-containing protein n=1 Tax=Photobacterium damselae TaxID=38293 RepID=UPI004068F29F
MEINGGGTTYCTLKWRAKSDWRNGDGASLDTDFPFNFKAFAYIANFEDVDRPENHIEIDNCSWHD